MRSILSRLVLLFGVALSMSSCGLIRPIWRDLYNTDMKGRIAPPLEHGRWVRPGRFPEKASAAAPDWRPESSTWRMLVFLLPH